MRSHGGTQGARWAPDATLRRLAGAALGLVVCASLAACPAADRAKEAAAGGGKAAGGATTDGGGGRSSAASPWVKARAPSGVSLLEVPAEVLTNPESTGAVVAPFPGRLTRIFVRAGQQVRVGDPVAAVVMPQLVDAAGHYAAARTRAEAYRTRRAQLEKLRSEGLAKTAEIAEVETHIGEALADQQATMATLRSGGLDPRGAAGLIARGGVSTLRSPVTGIVVEVDAAIGEMREGAGKPIARIIGEGDPRVQARTAHRLPADARFEFVTPGTRIAVKLLAQSPAIDARDGTRLSWFEPPRGTRLRQGTTGRLQVILDAAQGVVAVPAGALGLDAGKSYVTVRAGTAGRRVDVEVLATSGADALVRGPLHVDDEVAAEARGAHDGQEAAPGGAPAGQAGEL